MNMMSWGQCHFSWTLLLVLFPLLLPVAVAENPFSRLDGGSASAQMGRSIALSESGEFLIAAAPFFNGAVGRAALYQRDESTGNYGAIHTFTGSAGGLMGWSVAIDESASYIALGEPGVNSNRGRVHVLKTEHRWLNFSTTVLTPTPHEEVTVINAGWFFGGSLQIFDKVIVKDDTSGDIVDRVPLLAVGAWGSDRPNATSSGSVYLYVEHDDAWTYGNCISPEIPQANAQFGFSISGGIRDRGGERQLRLAVGAPGANGEGAASLEDVTLQQVFNNISSSVAGSNSSVIISVAEIEVSTEQVSLLESADPQAGAQFGYTVRSNLYGAFMTSVSSPFHSSGGAAGAGIVEVFDEAGGSTALGSSLAAPEFNDNRGLGLSISSDGYTLAVGGLAEPGGRVDLFHLLDENTNVWQLNSTIVAGWGAVDQQRTGDWFGFSVALAERGDWIAAGAPVRDNSAGAVYASCSRPSCRQYLYVAPTPSPTSAPTNSPTNSPTSVPTFVGETFSPTSTRAMIMSGSGGSDFSVSFNSDVLSGTALLMANNTTMINRNSSAAASSVESSPTFATLPPNPEDELPWNFIYIGIGSCLFISIIIVIILIFRRRRLRKKKSNIPQENPDYEMSDQQR